MILAFLYDSLHDCYTDDISKLLHRSHIKL